MHKARCIMSKMWLIEEKKGYSLVINQGGAVLGFDPAVTGLIEQDGYAFKDLNGNGILDPFEDWRLPAEERARDLVKRIALDEKLGLMMQSGMFFIYRITEQALREQPMIRLRLNLQGLTAKDFEGIDPTQPSFKDERLLWEDKLRNWCIAAIENPELAVEYVNHLQSFAEGTENGIPVILCTNPRSSTDSHGAGGGGGLSHWPCNLGLGATFRPENARNLGKAASQEYRALGIVMTLEPQIDPATDPRWSRCSGTFGEDYRLNADMARALCDGLQTSGKEAEISGGWGYESVIAMPKHWPGSTGEGGRESHDHSGKYAIFPNDQLKNHMIPWKDGAFRLDGPTGEAASLMTCYDVLWGQGQNPEEEGKGAAFMRSVIDGTLREQLKWDGFVVTDWGITDGINGRTPKTWGMESNTVAERIAQEIEAGCDQLGGFESGEKLLEGYRELVRRHGQEWTDARIDLSVYRILRAVLRLGLFENPYLDPEKSKKTIGCAEFCRNAEKAHRESVVLLKNKNNVLPIRKQLKVYIAEKKDGGYPDRSGTVLPLTAAPGFASQTAVKYLTVTDNPDDADCAIVRMDSPKCGTGFNSESGEYIPISLQYSDYTAVAARGQSISYDRSLGETNRSYQGRSVKTWNKYDLECLIETRRRMNNKPVVVVLNCENPTVPKEFEPLADAVLVHFAGTPDYVILEALSGAFEPQGLLPMQMPADMETVERQMEDTPRDMIPYMDECGNSWDFAFGMNWNGVITDERTEKYKGGIL